MSDWSDRNAPVPGAPEPAAKKSWAERNAPTPTPVSAPPPEAPGILSQVGKYLGDTWTKTSKNLDIGNVLRPVSEIDSALGQGDWGRAASAATDIVNGVGQGINPLNTIKAAIGHAKTGDMSGATADLLSYLPTVLGLEEASQGGISHAASDVSDAVKSNTAKITAPVVSAVTNAATKAGKVLSGGTKAVLANPPTLGEALTSAAAIPAAHIPVVGPVAASVLAKQGLGRTAAAFAEGARNALNPPVPPSVVVKPSLVTPTAAQIRDLGTPSRAANPSVMNAVAAEQAEVPGGEPLRPAEPSTPSPLNYNPSEFKVTQTPRPPNPAPDTPFTSIDPSRSPLLIERMLAAKKRAAQLPNVLETPSTGAGKGTKSVTLADIGTPAEPVTPAPAPATPTDYTQAYPKSGLTTGKEMTPGSGGEVGPGFQIRRVPTDKITPLEDISGDPEKAADVERYAQQMREGSEPPPLAGHIDPATGNVTITSGSRRLAAAKLAGSDDLPVAILNERVAPAAKPIHPMHAENRARITNRSAATLADAGFEPKDLATPDGRAAAQYFIKKNTPTISTDVLKRSGADTEPYTPSEDSWTDLTSTLGDILAGKKPKGPW